MSANKRVGRFGGAVVLSAVAAAAPVAGQALSMTVSALVGFVRGIFRGGRTTK